MKIVVKKVKNSKTWDNFAQKFSPNNFLSSWHWSDFNDRMGDKTLHLGIYENGKLVGICPVTKTISKKGNFLLAQAGPLFLKKDRKYLKAFIDHLKVLAHEGNFKYVRIRPLDEDTKQNKKALKQLGLVGAPVRVPAEVTWILDLTKSEEEILNNMRKTTRYLIKKALKDGVEVRVSKKISDLNIFHKLEEHTVEKHKFHPFSKKYVRTQFEIFKRSNDALIFLAKHKGKIHSTAVITFYGDTAFYNHGASVDTKVPVSYAIQWAAILEAKKRNKKYYNFWGGIAPENQPSHPWRGITLFKTGFGGFKHETIHAHDLPTSKLYKPIALYEKIRYRLKGHTVS